MAKTDEERAETKKARMLEKAMRMPLNDVILKVQDGSIEIKDLIGRIETKVAEKVKEGMKDGGK